MSSDNGSQCYPNWCAVIVLIGLPGSGKTSFCQRLLQSETNSWTQEVLQSESSLDIANQLTHIKFIHICYDQFEHWIRQENKSCDQEEDMLALKLFRRAVLELIDSLIQTLTTRNTSNYLTAIPERLKIPAIHQFFESTVKKCTSSKQICLLIDDNMYYRSMRYEYYQVARKSHIGFGEIFLNATLADSIARNCKRSSDMIDEAIIMGMKQKLEPPNGASFPWEANSVVIQDIDKSSLASVVEVITKALQNPVVPYMMSDELNSSESRRVSAEEILQQSDLIIRQLVRKEIQSHKEAGTSPNDMKDVANRVNRIKPQVLQFVKSNIAELRSTMGEITNCSKDVNSSMYKYIVHIFHQYLQT